MNRPRKKNLKLQLPPCVYLKHGAYYFVKGGKWERLGTDLEAARKKWSMKFGGQPGYMPELISKAMAVIVRSVKPNTVRQYQMAAKKLANALAEFRPKDVTHSTVAKLRLQWADTPNMANRCITVLRMVFHYAIENEIVPTNPVIGARRYTEARRKRLLSVDELAGIYQNAGPRLRVIIDLCIRTGQRIGDVLKIHRNDLTDEGIKFVQQKTGVPRTIEWSDELREVVARAKGLHDNVRALTLLHNRYGKTPDYRTVRDQWDKACKAAGVKDAHLHDLRALSATTANRQDLDSQALMGHTTQAQTARYLRDRESVVVQGPSFGQSKNLLDRKRQ